MNAIDDYRRAAEAQSRASRRYSAALGNAHRKPDLDLEAAYVAEMAAQARAARALKRMMMMME